MAVELHPMPPNISTGCGWSRTTQLCSDSRPLAKIKTYRTGILALPHVGLTLRAAAARVFELRADGRNRVQKSQPALRQIHFRFRDEIIRWLVGGEDLHEWNVFGHNGDQTFGRLQLQPANVGEAPFELGINPTPVASDR